MSADKKYLPLEGRILEVPRVIYTSNEGEKSITPYNGSWNMKGAKFHLGAKIKSWALLNLANPSFCNEEAVNKFIKLICETASDQGMMMPRPSIIETDVDSCQTSVEVALRGAKEKHDAEFVLVVLPERSKGVYGEVKKAAETTIGLVTQCILATTLVKKCSPQIASNLCQKINCKMFGINHLLLSAELKPIMKESTLIIGATVTHPSPTLQSDFDCGISIAAVVGSLDRHSSRYAASVRAQHGVADGKPIEFIEDLENMVVQLLRVFHRNTGRVKPSRIIFYREGVCEKHFESVGRREVTSVRMACRTMQAEGFHPDLTYIIVQKGHQVRFMPHCQRDGIGRMRNIPPGTTVDTGVADQFVLASHFTHQGISRPCLYSVLENDNLSMDYIKSLTFHLCHACARSTTGLSRPVPVLYSRLAASRALRHLEAANNEDHSIETLKKMIKVKDGLADSMYFV